MPITPEVFHEAATDDPHAWQPIASLAATLGIAERTVRHRTKQGTVERFTARDGRAYYRAIPEPVATTEAGNLPAVIAHHLARLDALGAELITARVEAATATATTVATLSRLDDAERRAEEDRQTIAAERARSAALDAERQALARHLEDAKARVDVAEKIAAAPWYAFRRRRRLRRELVAPSATEAH